ncbi:hypothetical protein JMG10_01440 [Nostoc ellipsosporum NOK]|nr:hypothetical protein [Nostoc ellipsosporum NOK]
MQQQRIMVPTLLRRLFILAALFFLAAGAHAQTEAGLEERVRKQTDNLYTELPLRDSAQYQEVYDINLKYAGKMQEAVQQAGSKMAKLKAARSVQADKDAAMKKVLSAEQYKKYKDIMEERKDKARTEWRNRKG